MAGQIERCETWISCPKRFNNDDTNTGTTEAVLFLLPCVSTENVQATQNKTQLPACRGVSEQLDIVESTSFTATGQIELRDTLAEAFANLIFDKACKCEEMCFFFLTVVGDDPVAGADPLPLVETTIGKVICGVPDATWNRDNSNKSLSFTVTPTSFAGTYNDWKTTQDDIDTGDNSTISGDTGDDPGL